MQIARKRLGVVTAAVCLVAALVCGGAYALAAGGFPGAGDNTLKANVSSNDYEFAEDIAKANVVVDVYKIADATPDENYVTYHYKLVSPFGSDALVNEEMDAEAWQALAESSAKKVTASTEMVGTLNADGSSSLKLDGGDGLYLLMPHGDGLTPEYGDDVLDSLMAASDTNGYMFAPSITAAPTKNLDPNGTIGTADSYGDWIREITVTLKPEQKPLTGDLEITKNVTGFSGEAATFVFHITGDNYDNYASVYFDGGESKTTTVHGIPAGTTVTVTEVYTGPRYEAAGATSAEATIVSDVAVKAGAKTVASVSFANKPNGNNGGGHGIENNFQLVSKGDSDKAWNWELVKRNGVDQTAATEGGSDEE